MSAFVRNERKVITIEKYEGSYKFVVRIDGLIFGRFDDYLDAAIYMNSDACRVK